MLPKGSPCWDLNSKKFEFKETLHHQKSCFLTVLNKSQLEKVFFIANFFHLLHTFPDINKSNTLELKAAYMELKISLKSWKV